MGASPARAFFSFSVSGGDNTAGGAGGDPCTAGTGGVARGGWAGGLTRVLLGVGEGIVEWGRGGGVVLSLGLLMQGCELEGGAGGGG